MSLLNSDHASAHQGSQVRNLAISLTKCFLPAQREEAGLGTEQPCPRGRETSENSQKVPLLVLCQLCPQLRAQAGYEAGSREDPACCSLSGPQLVVQSCLTLCNPMDCSPPGSSVRGVLQARTLEWAAKALPRGSSQPRDRTRVSHMAGRCFR